MELVLILTFTVSGFVAGQDRVLVGPRASLATFTGDGISDLDFSTAPNRITNVGDDFVASGFLIGQTVDVIGSALNDGTYNVITVSALFLEVAETLVAELDVAATVTQTAGLNRRMWLVATLLDAVAETALVVKTGTDTVAFPTSPTQINWPATGIGADNTRLRIERDNGVYERIPYDSHDSIDTFTLGTPITGASETIALGNAPDTLTRSTGNFLTEGFEASATATLAGSTTGGNDIQYVIQSISADGLVATVTPTPPTPEAGSGSQQLTGNGWDFLAAGAGEAAINNDVFLAFVDVLADATTEAFTGVHEAGADRELFVRVRDGGATPIKTFESVAGTFTAVSSTIAAVRT